MHHNDNWHKVCKILEIDPWRYEGISIHKDGRVHVLEPKWQQLQNSDINSVTDTKSSPQQRRRLKRAKPQVKPIYWDYKFVREVAETEKDPVHFLTSLTGCSRGAAQQAIKRSMGAQW